MKIRTRLLLGFLGCGLVPLLIIAVLSYQTASSNIDAIGTEASKGFETKAFDQLVALRDTKKIQLNQFFKSKRDDVNFLVEFIKGQRTARLSAIAENKAMMLEDWHNNRETEVTMWHRDPTIVNAAMVLTGRRNSLINREGLSIVDSEAKSVYAFIESWQGDDESLKTAISRVKVGETGYVWVTDYQGNYVVSKGRTRDGDNIWQAKDSTGNLFIQEAISKAKNLTGDAVDHEFYPWQNPGETKSRDKVAALLHFPQRQWVIGVSTYFDELIDMEKYRSAVLDMFKNNQKAYDNYRELKLLDLEGNHLASLLGIDNNESEKNWFKGALEKSKLGGEKQLYCSTIEYCPELNKPSIHLSHVVRNPDTDEPIAMIAADANVDLIQKMVLRIPQAWVIPVNHTLWDADFVMRTDSPRAPEPTTLKQKVETDGVKTVFSRTETKKDNAADQEFIYKNYLGNPVLGSNSYIKGLDLALITEMKSKKPWFRRFQDRTRISWLTSQNSTDGMIPFYSIPTDTASTQQRGSPTTTRTWFRKIQGHQLGGLVRQVLSYKKFGFADVAPYAPK